MCMLYVHVHTWKVCNVLDKPDPNEPVVGEGDIHVDDGPTIELPTSKNMHINNYTL